MITEKKASLALDLYEIESVKFGAFRLKLHKENPEAPLSPIYIDLRILRSFPKVMKSAIDVYAELIQALQYDYIADVPTAATPIVALLSYLYGIPMISPRINQKGHGTGSDVDGKYEPNRTALLIDDLVTTAGSKINAIRTLENNEIHVNDIVVLIDREQGGIEHLSKLGYNCYRAFKLSELLSFYLKKNLITKEKFDRVMDYLGYN